MLWSNFVNSLRAMLLSCLTCLLVLAGSAPSTGAAASLATPTNLTTMSTSTNGVSVSWKPVRNASSYRVQYATSRAFTSVRSIRVGTNATDITALSSGRTYYLRVAAVQQNGAVASGNSRTLEVGTRSTGYVELAPRDLKIVKASATSLSLSWGGRGSGIRYRVAYSSSASFAKNVVYRRESSTGITLTNLQPNTTYHVKVRVISNDGGNLSAYSPTITGATVPLTAPNGLAVTATANTTLALSWTPVGAPYRYRIQYATSSSMRGAKYARFSGGAAELSGLRAGTTYYLKVRVITASGTNLSPYSSAVKAKTASATAATHLPPNGLDAKAHASGQLTIGWAPRGSGLRYQVQYATDAAMSGATTLLSSGTSVTVRGLTAGTTYSFRVRVVGSTGNALSAYSGIVSARTRSNAPAELRVASYNIKCANCYSALPNEGTWYERRASVVAAVRAEKPDVIGFQEASQGWLKDAAGNPINKAQFEDLVERLGSPYKLTNTHRNNCGKSTSPTNCVWKDQGASQGTKIVYNSSTVELVSQGSKKLSKVKESDADRYVAWAVLQHKDTGRRFFFANTHLEFRQDTPGSSAYYNLRIAQTRQAVDVITANRQGLPAYFVGDFNSHKWSRPGNGPYDVLVNGKFIDPLGNTYASTLAAKSAIVGKRIRTNFSSYNGFATKAPSFKYTNGTYIDYIWVSDGIEVPEWETVVNVDANDNFIGTIPSDHNLLRATTVLP